MLQIDVKHSLIDTETIIQLSGADDRAEGVQCDLLSRGKNDTYFIMNQNGEKYVFRLYRAGYRHKNAILFEMDALNHLHEQGFRASYPIKKSNGDYLTEVIAPEGLRYGVLFTYSEGERPEINVENSEVIGKTLGRMHALTSGFSSSHKRGFELDTNRLLDEPEAVISPIVEKYLGSQAMTILQTVVENTKADLAEYNLETGLCHGNFYSHNMHVYNGEIDVFDFDDCAIGYRAYDIAVSWWDLKNNYKNLEQECWEAFLKGYLSERNLSEDDIRSLPLFITARRIWLMGMMITHDDVWGTNWINKRIMALFIGQLRTDRLGDEDLRELDEHEPK
ncbi:hypothetical protein GCM10007063_08400 [Lentibacillus kapialis]|uniref:Aminoglycoside phosphotransferase domain-containing protein n=1 Tax=Lentibacillus kapialis TaxID=340214 RepID=A0A917PQJ3_9BACI|nr:phosphotransferase [Lentibacillus kapialis]GGJ88213.1 hypothetical protein GCM10007063_08400 [Lentibacillus kapialis]